MNETTDLVKSDSMLSVQQISERISTVNSIVKKIMVEDVHFGKIPGCGNKPTLLKPGAEVLAMAFNLDLQTTIEIIDLPRGHREYRAATIAFSRSSGSRLGNGEGSATTMESKWRYRAENTGEKVPKEYWTDKDIDLIGGAEFSVRKQDGTWYICHKVEHDNPADNYNTCLKMAEKRSRVACVLNVTCASNLFSEDLEDFVDINDNIKTSSVKKAETKSSQSGAKKETKPAKKDNTEKNEVMVKIKEVTSFEGVGKTTGKPFTQYTIKSIMDGEYKTFNKTIKEDAEKIVNTDVEALILFKSDKFGNTIEHFEIINA